MNRNVLNNRRFAVVIFILIGLTGCNSISRQFHPRRYFIIGDEEQKQQLTLLFNELDQPGQSPEYTFHYLREIISILRKNGETDKLNLLLTTQVENFPANPYNGFYLYIVAHNYMQNQAYPFAIHYMERILHNYSDLLVDNQSIHFLCLNNLIQMEEDYELLAEYYAELIRRFAQDIDIGLIQYNLASVYDQIGEWNLAIEAYKEFLKHPDTEIAGDPSAYKRVKTMMAMIDYPGRINWTFETREELINTLKWIIRNKLVREFNNLMAKEGFFAISWAEDEGEKEDTKFIPVIGITYLASPANKWVIGLDKDSNDQEAFLETYGWSVRRNTWYLYLRRVYYPLDPEIHRNWEWAGIYFGEKPFSTED